MKKTKQIAAIIGIVILVSMYILSLVAALSSWEYSNQIFTASLFCTIAVPAVIYGIIVVYKRIHKDEEENMTYKELKKLNEQVIKKEENKAKK